MKLSAQEIYSIQATAFDGFWVSGCFAGDDYKVEGFTRSEDETCEDMRDAGYVFIENSYQFGCDLWVEASDIQR